MKSVTVQTFRPVDGYNRHPYNVSDLAPAEEFLKATVADLFKLREAVWFKPDIRERMNKDQLEKIQGVKRRNRSQIRGVIGALRLVRDARMANPGHKDRADYVHQALLFLRASAGGQIRRRGW